MSPVYVVEIKRGGFTARPSTRKLFEKVKKFRIGFGVLTHIASRTRGDNVISSIAPAARNGNLVLTMKLDTGRAAIVTAIIMLFKNRVPLFFGQVVRQSRNTGDALLTPMIDFIRKGIFILFLVFEQVSAVCWIVLLKARLVVCFTFGLALSALFALLVKIRAILAILSLVFINGIFVYGVTPIMFTSRAHPVCVMRFHLPTYGALANLVRFYPTIITGIAHITSAQFARATAHGANNSFSFASHLVT